MKRIGMKKHIILMFVLVISTIFAAGCSEDMEVKEVKGELTPYKVKTVDVPKKYYDVIWGIDKEYLYGSEMTSQFKWFRAKIPLKDSKRAMKLPTLPGFDTKLLEIKNGKVYADLVGEKKYKDGKKSYRIYKLYIDKNGKSKKEVLYETKIAAFPQAAVMRQDKIIIGLVREKGVDEIISIDAETGERKLIHRGKYSYDSKGRVSGTCLAGNFQSSGNTNEENFCYQVMNLKKDDLNYYKTIKSGIYLYSIKSGKSRRVIEYPRLVEALSTTGDVICFMNDRGDADKVDKDTGEFLEVYVRRGDEFKPLKLRGLENCDAHHFRFLGDDRIVALGGDDIYVVNYKKKTFFRKKSDENQHYMGYGKRELVVHERLGNGKIRLSYYK